MDNITKQLKKGAKQVHLSQEEKVAMKHTLVSHMKANPVRSEVLARLHSRGANGIPSPFSVNNLRNKKTMPIFLIVGLLMSGSVSFAAENTVPGDILYPVKVHVNENVRGAVVVTPKAQAVWDVQLVERRLQEVEKLASHDNASPKAQEAAKRNLERYMERAKGDIETFEKKNNGAYAILTASQLAELLRDHENIFLGLSTGGTATSTASVATSTASVATTTAGVTASTTIAFNPRMSKEAYKDILKLLKESRKDAEEQHKELKHKFENDDDEDEDENEHRSFIATTTASVGTTTASWVIYREKKEGDRKSEIRQDHQDEKNSSQKNEKQEKSKMEEND